MLIPASSVTLPRRMGWERLENIGIKSIGTGSDARIQEIALFM
jgi:hypothetical protein